MAELKAERRRLLTRSRSSDIVERSGPSPLLPTSLETTKCKGKTKSSQSVGASSDSTGSTEQSYTMSGEYGGPNTNTNTNTPSHHIPLEVVIINDDEEHIPSIRGHIVDEDVEQKLRDYETLLVSYKRKLKSSEHLNSSLHNYLTQTQGYAENLLSERQELLEIIRDMEHEDKQRVDQELLLKFIMCTSLFLYFLGGSHKYLVATVVLQLIVTLVNIVF